MGWNGVKMGGNDVEIFYSTEEMLSYLHTAMIETLLQKGTFIYEPLGYNTIPPRRALYTKPLFHKTFIYRLITRCRESNCEIIK